MICTQAFEEAEMLKEVESKSKVRRDNDGIDHRRSKPVENKDKDKAQEGREFR